MDFHLRDYDPDADTPAIVAIRQACFPHEITTVEAFRWHWSRTPPGSRPRTFVAEGDGRVVGYATAALEWRAVEPGQGTITVTTHPEHQGRGVGTALADAAEDHLLEAGARVVRGSARVPEADPFARNRGYERRSTAHKLRLDLAELPPVPPRPAPKASRYARGPTTGRTPRRCTPWTRRPRPTSPPPSSPSPPPTPSGWT